MIGQMYGAAESAAGSLNWRLKIKQLKAARCLVGLICGIVISAILLIAVGDAFGLLISNTDSAAPAGIHRIASSQWKRGEFVAACLPIALAQQGLARGYLRTGPCPGNAEPVGKILGALPGDAVQIESNAVSVNGVRFARSAIAEKDSAGRPLAHQACGRYRAASNQMWLFGFHDRRSWDSRYFGPFQWPTYAAGSNRFLRGGRDEQNRNGNGHSQNHTNEQGLRLHHLANLGGLMAIAGLDQEPPDFLLGVLLSVAREAAALTTAQRAMIMSAGRAKLDEELQASAHGSRGRGRRTFTRSR